MSNEYKCSKHGNVGMPNCGECWTVMAKFLEDKNINSCGDTPDKTWIAGRGAIIKLKIPKNPPKTFRTAKEEVSITKTICPKCNTDLVKSKSGIIFCPKCKKKWSI